MLEQALKCPLTPVLAVSNSNSSSKLQGLKVHPIIFGLKYNLNFLKGSFVARRPFSERGSSFQAIF